MMVLSSDSNICEDMTVDNCRGLRRLDTPATIAMYEMIAVFFCLFLQFMNYFYYRSGAHSLSLNDLTTKKT